MSQPSLRHVHRAVHRLHRRVRKKRLLVDGVDLLRGARNGRRRHRRRGAPPRRASPTPTRAARRCRPWRASRSGPRPTAGRRPRGPAWPPTCGCATIGDRVVEPHDLAHARHRLRLRLIERERACRRRSGEVATTANLHPGSRLSMPNFALPSTLPARVEPPVRRADQLEIARLLERHVLGHRQLRGGIHELRHSRAAAGRRVHDRAILRAAGGRIDIPALRRGGHEHDARRGARAPQRRA